MIELKKVSAGYGSHTVLRDVSVSFEKGTLTGIIGVNGCGKSTLLKTVLGAIPIRSGSIALEGTPLEQISRKAIAQKIAYLSQGKSTPDMTVEQLVLHGRFPHLNYPRRYTQRDYDLAFAAMERTGIAEYAKTPLHALSGGMGQAAYIAMALAQGTEYILLDEPTTYLDIGHQLEIMRLLRALADSGKAVVAVMHDLPMAFTFSDRIVLLNNGQVVSNDQPQRVCKDKTLAQVFGVSVTRSEEENAYHYKYEYWK